MIITSDIAFNNHATFRKNELLIQRELIQAIKQRRIGLRATEIYTQAKLSRPTFYLHCRSCDDALRRYEASLLYEFKNLSTIPLASTSIMRRDIILTILMNFLSKHRAYFVANFENYNFYLLTALLEEIESVLLPPTSNHKDGMIRIAVIEAIISYWGKHENFNTELIPYYTDMLQHPSLPRW